MSDRARCGRAGGAIGVVISGRVAIPFELLLALPYLVVIAALVVSGRNVAYPGAYLKPYRRD